MADLAQVFNILADDSTGAGEAAISRVEGEVAASKEGLIGFSFKDSSGNVILPQLNSSGAVIVDTQSGRTCLDANGEVAAGSTSITDIATITASLTKKYDNFGIICSCLRASLFQLIYIDDAAGTPTETTLAEFIVGPGAYTVCCNITCLNTDTTGQTGTQEFVLRAKNFVSLSSLRGTIVCQET